MFCDLVVVATEDCGDAKVETHAVDNEANDCGCSLYNRIVIPTTNDFEKLFFSKYLPEEVWV